LGKLAKKIDLKQMIIITKEDKEEEILTESGATILSIPILKWITELD
jgi:hypothetical protein